MALVAGRVYCLLEGDPQLAHTLLPLMADSLASSAAGSVAAVTSAAAVPLRPDVFACLAHSLAGVCLEPPHPLLAYCWEERCN